MSRKSDSSADTIRSSAKRMQRARSKPSESPLRGFSVFGIVGWSVAVPTVAGALVGNWLNRVAPQNYSWTIALILGGTAIGIFIAWDWLSKERVRQEREDLESHANGDDL